MDFKKVLEFWFEETPKELHFAKNDDFDQKIEERFSNIHAEVASGKYDKWKESAEGTLAYIIVLDQFSRNMFRDNAMAFAYDEKALKATLEGLEKGFDLELPEERRKFFYMPLMHSEDIAMHELAMGFFKTIGGKDYLQEIKHNDIIEMFGRYPHRNEALGRESTEEEINFLKNGGDTF